MPFPGVTVDVTNGNLAREITVIDGVPALMVTVSTAGLVAATKQVYSLAEAETAGYTEAAEPFAHKLIKEYYDELGGKQLLYVFGTAQSMTMAAAVTATEANGISKLLREGNGKINLVAIARNPASSYQPGTGFLDSDVSAAVTACKSVAQAQQAANTPVRLFIEGRVADASKSNAYEPKTAGNGFAAVVLGGTANDGSAAVTIALARAVKYAAHVKLGNGENGALSAQQVYIGSDEIEKRSDMETLHDAGYLTFHHRPGVSGYYFGRDNMCSEDDYRILAHGRVTDKAQRVAAAAFVPFIESDIRMEADGSINATDAKYIEDTLSQAELGALSGQVSGVKVDVPLNQNVIETSRVNINLKVQPLGYMTWINITMGLATTI